MRAYPKKSTNAVHVVPSVAEEASGVSYAVLRLCESLINLGDRVELHCLAATENGFRNFVHVHRPGIGGLRPLGWSADMYSSLLEAARRSEVIHNHSLWMMPNVYSAWAAKRSPCKLVTSPHGTLSPMALARSRWRKKLFWPFQRDTLTRAACVHATGETEYRDIRALGLRAPVAIIPYGIDIPEPPKVVPGTSRRRLLFLGRIHPIKGVDMLLSVWRRLENEFPDWVLAIAGPGESDYLASVQKLVQDLQLRRLSFLGPRYGIHKSLCYWGSELFVLPSHSENFGFAVAEALAHGTPVVVSQGAPWEGLESNRCGWWIPLSEESLYNTLYKAMSMPPKDLRDMGARGRNWMRREFGWEEVGRRMARTYEWILHGGEPPTWVKME